MKAVSTRLSLSTAVAIVVGSIIGSGLFMKPASMAQQLGSPLALLGVWVLAGIMSLLGALVYAELGVMMPKTGGLFVHFDRLFGSFTAFLYGWSAFAVINTASVAAIAVVCASYLGEFVPMFQLDRVLVERYTLSIPWVGTLYPLKDAGVKMTAVSLVLLLSFFNSRSLKLGGVFQRFSTVFNLAIITLLVVAIFSSAKGSVSHFVDAGEGPWQGISFLSGLAVALTGAFFAYDGWINIVTMAGELEDPKKNIPLSLLLGVLICMGVYMLVNMAYLYVLPVHEMAGSTLVAADAIRVARGEAYAGVAAAMIVCCTLGAVNAHVMATARITYAMGRDGAFAAWAGRLDGHRGTPKNALLLHGCWISILIVSGSFDLLADMFVFITWLAYALGAIGILYWRYKRPDLDRPYKVGGHPYVTLFFILFSVFYLGVTLYKDVLLYTRHQQPVINSLLALLIVALGIPFYFLFRRSGSVPR